MKKKTFVIMGCGSLGTIVARAYQKHMLEGYELLGAYSRKEEDSLRLLQIAGAGVACSTIDDLLALKADYLIETSSIALLKEVALQALKQGTSIVPLSIGAFADSSFYEEAKEAAIEGNCKIHIPNGAVGGFDVLQTLSVMAEAGVRHERPFGADDEETTEFSAGIHTLTRPGAFYGSDLFRDSLVESPEVQEVFSGTTAEAIQKMPTHLNVAVATALASTGPDVATAAISSKLDFIGDDHRIEANTHGIRAIVDIYSSTSAIAGWSVVALLRNLMSPIEFF